MTREEAIRILASSCIPGSKQTEALETLIPELKESEDESTRKALIETVKCIYAGDTMFLSEQQRDRYLDWLEKQKENPKSADSIPSDCTSDVKCEDRWHKVGDSLPDNPREVLCKDEAGNYFIGRYYVGEGWEISNYDDEDKPHHLNPPVSKWIDFPLEKQKDLTTENIYKHSRERMSFGDGQQKEQKPSLCDECKKKSTCLDTKYGDDRVVEQCINFVKMEQKPAESISQLTVQGKGVYKICPRCKERMVRDDSMVYTSMPPQYRYECPKCGESECDTVMYDNPEMEEQKPAEWSEEDADILNCCISSIEEAKENRYAYKETDGDTSYDREIAWLKSLRPSWKPSEEQMKALRRVVNKLANTDVADSVRLSIMYDNLKKL